MRSTSRLSLAGQILLLAELLLLQSRFCPAAVSAEPPARLLHQVSSDTFSASVFAVLVLFLASAILLFFWLRQRKVVAQLRKSEARFRAVFEAAAEGMVITNPQGELLKFNPAFCAMVGYQPKDLDQLDIHALTHPDDREATRRFYHEFTPHGSAQARQYQKRYHAKDGRIVWARVITAPLDGGSPGEDLFISLVRDITEQKNAEAALVRRSRQLEVLSRAGQAINQDLEVASVMRALVEAALELAEASSGAAGMVIGNKMVFSEYCAEGRWVAIDYSFDPGYGVPGWVLEHGQSCIINNPAEDPRVVQEVRAELGFFNLIDTPLLNRDGDVLGCFEIHNRRDHRPFDREDMVMLQALASSAVIALENVRILDSHRNIERRLRQSEQRYRELFDQTPLSIWELDFSRLRDYLSGLDPGGGKTLEEYLGEHPEVVRKCLHMMVIKDINQATLRLFGAPDKLHLKQALPTIYDPVALDDFQQQLVAIHAGRTRFQGNLTLQTIQRRPCHVAMNWLVPAEALETYERVLLSMTDITELKQFEVALKRALHDAQEARDNLDAMFQSVAEGIFMIDGAEQLVAMNPAAEVFFGVEAARVRQQPLAAFLNEPALLEFLRQLAGSGKASGEDLFEITNRQYREVRSIRVRARAVEAGHNRPAGWVIIFRDVTRELQLDRLKSEFVATAAHELRTPLASVMGYAELLQQEGTSGSISVAERNEYLGVIIDKAEHLTGIVDDLLDLSRSESGRSPTLQRELLDFGQLVQTTLENFPGDRNKHRLNLQAPTEGPVILADHGKLQQVLNNLLSNAVKYSPRGGEVQVRLQVGDGLMELEVIDQGVGMSVEQQTKAFDKFYRGDSSDTAVSGLGLGLSICREIVEAHSGSIWLQSSPGRGTRVGFRLPLAEPAPVPPAGTNP